MEVRIIRRGSTPSTITVAIIIPATIIRSPIPPEPRPRIDRHIRVNSGVLLHGGGLRHWFAGGIDQSIQHGVTGAVRFEGNNLTGSQNIAVAGVLDLARNDSIADVGLQHGFDFGQRRPRRRPGNGIGSGDASGQHHRHHRQQKFNSFTFHSINTASSSARLTWGLTRVSSGKATEFPSSIRVRIFHLARSTIFPICPGDFAGKEQGERSKGGRHSEPRVRTGSGSAGGGFIAERGGDGRQPAKNTQPMRERVVFVLSYRNSKKQICLFWKECYIVLH